jgi:ABC-2 type transport system ATP-binding protein
VLKSLLARKRAAAPDVPAASGAGVLPPPVAVRHLYKSYGAVTAVDNLSFTIEAGSITALLGGNGAGKTTTISMLMGLLIPTSGEIRVFGADMARDRYKALYRMNFESPYVDMPMRLSVRRNLETFAALYGVADPKRRVAAMARELRLEEFLDRPTGRLSAGQKTRVGLAKSLINAPELLLLDEPTASLDPDTAEWVREKLIAYRAARGASVLLASHNMSEVERLADRVIMLEKGRIVEDGPPHELLASYGRASLEEVFLHIARRGARPSAHGADDRAGDADA